MTQRIAPGGPGLPPNWTSSRKAAVGTARGTQSHVWFTIGSGILNEIYYPRVDCACTRDLGFIITDGAGFFSEEKRDTHHEVSWLAPGIPAFLLRNTCCHRRYCIEKHVISDPVRHVILQRIRFSALAGCIEDYRLFALLNPHLKNQGDCNSACLGDYKGLPMLFAMHEDVALALACSRGWSRRSVGFFGFSDGWQILATHGSLVEEYEEAKDGNVVLTGEIPLTADEIVVALAFGRTTTEAGHRARASLNQGFESVWRDYREQWEEWQAGLPDCDAPREEEKRQFRIGLAVLATHEAKDFPGAIIASLSVPWGTVHRTADRWGYHVVWPRDSCECSGALLAAGAGQDVLRALQFFQTTQEADGHWTQNMWLDGRPAWDGIQMDETAAPILLLDLARRNQVLSSNEEVFRYWPMARLAAAFICRNGPASEQDRWEENPGYSPYTLSAEIAALLVVAEMAEELREGKLARYLRETADAWNDAIERWLYVRDTRLSRAVGVEGYYMRVLPPQHTANTGLSERFVKIKNHSSPGYAMQAAEVVSPDALALVRFGLRSAMDPRILNTVQVIDATLKVDTPLGPVWHRYSEDGYGEGSHGEPFDGDGIGRGWPLLTAERAHYELARGQVESATALLHAMEAFAGQTGLIPEQVWDAEDLPEKGLIRGGPTGSARPLVWAHAEYIKLQRSIREGRVYDLPPQTFSRYVLEKTKSKLAIWEFCDQLATVERGTVLRIQTRAPARVRWSADGWASQMDQDASDTGLGVWFVDLPANFPKEQELVFTFHWPEAARWEGRNFYVRLQG